MRIQFGTQAEFWLKIRGERFAPQGVVLGQKRSAALDDGATGGMSAGILRAHYLAAAKVRLQSL